MNTFKKPIEEASKEVTSCVLLRAAQIIICFFTGNTLLYLEIC